MSKDPAFLFYSQDFYTGVATLTMEDRGKYITILCLMHQQGRMTEETICFLVGSVSVNLKSKFKVDNDGFWYNERLEIETERRKKYTESRRLNGEKGGRPKDGEKIKIKKHMVKHMDNHMENENDIKEYNNKVSEFLAMESWQEQLAIEYGSTKKRVRDLMEKFFTEQRLAGVITDTHQQYQSHFLYWFKKEINRKDDGRKISKKFHEGI